MADSNNIILFPAWGCNICFEESRDPVCTTCGDLFCWRCLYPWIHDLAKPCPVCRSPLTTIANIIPVYGTTLQGEPPQQPPAATTGIIPPRPHPPPRAPTTWHALQVYRETLRQMWRQEAIERARRAEADEGIAQLQSLIDADDQNLAGMRRQLNALRRRNAYAVETVMSGSQTSTSNAGGNGVNLQRQIHDASYLRHVLDVSVGRRQDGTR